MFYDRSTNSAAFCALQWMSLKPPALLCNTFINLIILAKHDKGLGYILANREILTPKCRISFIYPLSLTLNNFPIYTIDTILKRNV